MRSPPLTSFGETRTLAEFGSSSRSTRGIASTFVARTWPMRPDWLAGHGGALLMHSINAVGGDYVRNQLMLSVTNSLTFSE
jgi:hypothetical protein